MENRLPPEEVPRVPAPGPLPRPSFEEAPRETRFPTFTRFAPHFRGTTRSDVLPDLIAGLTVAALAIPQGLASALVAGVPPEMGLLAAAVPAVVAALFGSSPYLATGPTNPIALVVGVSVVAPVVASGAPVPIGTVSSVALLAGLMLIGFGLLGLGTASRFLSDSVIAGFVAGAGLLIALRLLPELAPGLPAPPAAGPLWPAVWPLMVSSAEALQAADPRALALGAAVPAMAVALRWLDRRIPAALLALALAMGAAYALSWTQGADALPTLGSAAAGGWSFTRPAMTHLGDIAAPALAIALLATLQSVGAARALGTPAGLRLDPDRELVSQGAANLSAALTGALPTSGSFTRSALVRSAGGRSRLAPALSGLLIAFLLPFIDSILGALPLAALVGLVVLSGVQLVRPLALRRAATTRGDTAVLCVTLGTVLWIGLLQALYAGLFLSLALLVRRAGRLQMMEMVRSGSGRFSEIPIDEKTGRTPVVLLHLEGDLNFAVAPELSDRLHEIGQRGPRVLVLRLKRARHLDGTVLEALRQTFAQLQEEGTAVVLCGLTDELAALLDGSELAATLGPEGLLRAGPSLFEGFERALARSREILRPQSDDEIFRTLAPAAWMYQV